MAEPFALQRRISKRILKDRPGMPEGMRYVAEQLRGKARSSPWAAIHDADWSGGLDRFIAWLDSLVPDAAPPGSLELLWFEVPSELNPPATMVLGFPKFMRELSEFGLQSQPACWPAAADDAPPIHHLGELDRVLNAAGWRQDIAEPTEHDRVVSRVYAISHAYLSLLVLNGLPRSRVPRIAGEGAGIAVTIGWHDGDAEPLALLKAGAWERFPARVAPYRPLHPNKPHMATRNLLLGMYTDIRQVRQRLDEDADVLARDNFGQSVLHIYIGSDLDTVGLLLDAGADPNAACDSGYSVLDCAVRHGGTTPKHLEILLARGARFSDTTPDGESPLHAVAGSGITERNDLRRAREMFRILLTLGYDINTTSREGLTPLWEPLRWHAHELDEFITHQAEFPYAGGTWDQQHDRIAALLLDLGADPNARYVGPSTPRIPPGASPLMVQRYDDDRLVRALLKAGADPTLMSDEGKTALDYARAAAAKPDDPAVVGPNQKGAMAVVAVLERASRTKGTTR